MKINLLRLLVFATISTPGALSSQNQTPIAVDHEHETWQGVNPNNSLAGSRSTDQGNSKSYKYFKNYHVNDWYVTDSKQSGTNAGTSRSGSKGFFKSAVRTKTLLGTGFTNLMKCYASITPYGPTSFCQGGSVVLHASWGNSYQWSTGATTQNITVTQSGTYYVTVTTGNCCETAQRTVTVYSNPTVSISANGPTTFCQGGNVVLTASGSGSFLWSTGATTASITVNSSGTYTVTKTNSNGCTATASRTVVVTPNPAATITPNGPTTFCHGGSVVLTVSSGSSYAWSTGATTQSITVNASGTYSVTVNNGQCTSTATRTVTVNPNPVVTITPNGPTTFCVGGSVQLTASAGSSYLWSTGATTQTISVNASGNYSVTVTTANGCTGSASRTVTVNANPTATITPGGPTTFCQGGSVVLTASAGASWLWSTGATTQSITVNSSGSYSVMVTNSSGCSSSCTAVQVTVHPNPTVTITANGPTTFCVGGSVQLTASAGSSYLWSTGATTQSITVNASGNYSVTVTNANGCTGSATRTVTVNANPTASITPGGPTTFCQGNSVTLTASAGASYAWSTGATTQSISANASGTYSVVVTNASGCSSSASVNVTVHPTPNVSISQSGPTTFCQGGSVTLTASGAVTYQWSTGATTASITVSTAGNYSVVGYNQYGCYASTGVIPVIVNPQATVTITAGGPTTFCHGGSVTLTASAAASYAWSTGATTQSITVNASGNYSVTATNANGCTASASQSVTVNPNPVVTITPNGPTTFCVGGSVQLTASAGSSYLWSTGATTQSINVNASGNYVVTVTNANGCTGSASRTVTVNANPTATITPGGPTTFCQGGSVVLTASAGASWLWSTGATTQSITVNASGSYSVMITNASGCTSSCNAIQVTVHPNPVVTITPNGPTAFCQGGSVVLAASAGTSYLWSTGAVTQNITVNASGSYSVVVTNANGCTGSASQNVTVNPNPVVTITPNGPTTFCQGGSVVLAASAGSSYLWSTGAITQNITVNAAGSYSVVVTNANGCSGSASQNVIVNPNPVVTITPNGPTTFCQGGSVVLAASAGSSYLWSTGAITQNITVNASGSYSVVVTNANGCSGSASQTVTVNPNPVATITPGGPTTFCAGGSVVLTASAGASWLWSTGATTQSITVTASGSYSVMVTNANGCSASCNAIQVTVHPNPVVTITPNGPTTFCQGGSVVLAASAGSSYLWSTGAITQNITVNASGSYSVVVTNANGCSGSATINVTVNPNPVVTITPNGPTSFCQGGSVVLAASAGSSYLWSTGAITQNITVNASGSYSVVVTNANGCSASASQNVTVNPNPVVTITPGGPTTFCQGGSVVLAASAGTSYLWSTGAITQNITVNASGTYSVVVNNGNGCSASASVNVTVNPNPVVTITPGGPTTFCQGGSVVLAASAGSSYLWSTGATTQNITVNASGSYSVVVTNANGCSGSASQNVIVNPNPVVTITPNGPTTFCQGGSVVLAASAGSSYVWSTGAITQNITVNASGNYSVVVTNANGCSGSATICIVVNPNPVVTITPNGPTTFCQGGSVVLAASSGASYLWSTGAITQNITVNASGTYSVVVTNANGCSGSASQNVIVNPNPVVTITPNGPTTFCQGGSVVLAASAGSSYLWSTGATTQSITINASGSYSVVVTNANGCSASASQNVIVNPNPVVTITPNGPTTFCDGGSVVLTASTGSSYLWSTGAITQSITANASGTYSVIVSNANGCSGSASINVTEHPAAIATITPDGPTAFCQGDSVILSANAGVAYLWSTGAVTQSITVHASGSYSVMVTDSNGCSAACNSIQVTVYPNPVVTITPNGPTAFCQGGSVVLTASAGASYLWSTGAITQSITANASGTYSVVVSNANGCSGSASINVTEHPTAVATITPDGPTTFCQGDSVELTANAGASYLWSNAAITQSIIVSASGNYSVTVTDSNGCSASASVPVTVLPSPQASITGPTEFCDGDSIVLHASNGTSWLWSTGAITQNITVNASGTYSVTISNGICTSTASITVTEHGPVAVTVTPDGPTTFCEGDSVILTANSGVSYIWNTGATTQSIVVDSTGMYHVMVTDSNGCMSACYVVYVNVLPSPVATISGQTEFCQGDSVVLHASNGTSWLWSTGATTQNITVNASGTYSVTISNGQCSSSASINVIEHGPVPVSVTASGPTTFCEGDSVILTVNSGVSYIWNTGDTTQSIVVDSSGMYHVMVTDSNGCMSVCAVVYINVLPSPVASITGQTEFCQGDSVVLHASNGTSYLWSTGDSTQNIIVNASGTYSVIVNNGACASTASINVTELPAVAVSVSTSGPTTFCQGDSVILTANSGVSYIWNTGDTTQSIVVDSSGMYHVMVTDSNGCMSACYVVYVNVLPAAVATITPGGPTSFCQGDSVILTASSGTAYLWSNGATSQSIVASASGSYSVTVNNGQCSATASINVVEHPAATATITANGPATFCAGDSVMLTANAGLSYLWSNGATSQSIVVNSTGTYSVIVADSNGCSASSAGILVTALPAPVATITPSGPTSFCQGDSVTLTASQGTAYAWSTGANTQSITVYASGTYSVTVGNFSCSSSASININEFSATAASATANGPTTFCVGDSVMLTANSGSAYLWSNGATSQSIVVYASGNYSVSVTDANGCSSASAGVNVIASPAATATITPNGPTTFCHGDSVLLSANAGPSYLWSNGATSQDIMVYNTGTYSVNVGSGACSASASINIIEHSASVVTVSANGPTTFCAGDSVTLSASAAAAYLWSNGATTPSTVIYASGVYSVACTDANGCPAASNAISVTVNPAAVASITPNGPTTFCQGDSVILSANNGNSYLWSTGAMSQDIIVYSSGTYSVTVSNGACSATALINVNITPVLPATISSNGPLNFCQGDSVILTATTTGSYQWSTGATSQSIVVNSTGIYSVTVGSGACASTAIASVLVLSGESATILPAGPIALCEGDSVLLTASNGSAWLWSTGETTQSIVVQSSGAYTVNVSSACGTSLSPAVLVYFNPAACTADFTNSFLFNNYTFTNTSTGGTSYQWEFGDNTTSNEFSPVHLYGSAGTYLVTLIVSNGCSSDTLAQYIVIENNEEVSGGFYTGFSPNNDGHNDSWNIPMLEEFPSNNVIIINRWGNEVWKAQNYDNKTTVWTGQNLNGEELPDGTYYFIIKYDGKEKRGWVFIKR